MAMNRIPRVCILILVAGCGSDPSLPAVLQETEFTDRVVLEHAGPIDPESVLFTIHDDGRVSWKGKVQTSEEMTARASNPSSKVNRTPILFEVDPNAKFEVVGDVLGILTGKAACVNYSFLVATRQGSGVVVLPMQADKCMGIHFYDGRSEEKIIGGSRHAEKLLELIISAGEGGSMDVTAVNFTIPDTEPAIYYPPSGEKPTRAPKQPDISWAGDHPPCGCWTADLLRTFLSRVDVAALSPYILFKITSRETVSDVIRALSTLRSLRNIAIVPQIPTKQ
jgi:hypothetical protein